MDLSGSYVQLMSRLAKRRAQTDAIMTRQTSGELKPWEFRFLAEALLANTWLDWNSFVKQVLVASCQGTRTRNHVAIAARACPDNSEARVRYEFKKYQKGDPVAPGVTDSGQLEPTWAHPWNLIACINGLAPANMLTLQQAFGAGGLVGPKRIHLVRNACAHKSKVNRSAVRALRAGYSTSHFLDPIDILWAFNSATGAIAIFEWVTDLETIAGLATE